MIPSTWCNLRHRLLDPFLTFLNLQYGMSYTGPSVQRSVVPTEEQALCCRLSGKDQQQTVGVRTSTTGFDWGQERPICCNGCFIMSLLNNHYPAHAATIVSGSRWDCTEGFIEKELDRRRGRRTRKGRGDCGGNGTEQKAIMRAASN